MRKPTFQFLLAFCSLLPTFAAAQNQPLPQEIDPPKKFVFSGPVTEADCRDLPTASFEVRASGPRWKTADRLLIDCLPTKKKGYSAILTLTFVITEHLPPLSDFNRAYSFRWGESVNPKRSPNPMLGQFTKDPDRCNSFVALFTSRVSKDVTSTNQHLRTSPRWSVSCNGDDLWGMSMEFELVGKYPESL
ncbi:MAG: hypothetical protein ABSD75_21055 [Terriglobales bacterium]